MMSKKKAAIIIVAVVILTSVLTFVGTNSMSLVLGDKVVVPKATYNEMAKYSKLVTVEDIIKKYYVDKVDKDDESKLVEGAAKGLAAGLGDPYTVYWDPKEYEANTIQTEGEYAGVGLTVEPKDDKIYIVAPIEDTPAEKAGIKPGDVIARVNDKDMTGKDIDKAVSMMRGKAGTQVKLTIYREGAPSLLDFNVTRANIVLKSVKSEMMEDNIGYIRITAFQATTADSFKKALDGLKSKGMKALVLDLRDNGGGLLDQCVQVADELIGKGTIVYTIDNQNHKDVISSDSKKLDMPLAILVNGNTASASEIVSGAVKDTNSGTLVGTRTFGKGLVQTVVPIKSDNSAVKVTIARYYTPSGVCIQGKGIEPNVVVDLPDQLKQKPELTRQEDIQLSKAIEVVKSKIK